MSLILYNKPICILSRQPPKTESTMKSTLVWIIVGTVLMCGGDSVSAWGGVFNRFTPELLGNLGYGGGSGSAAGGNSANAIFYEVSENLCFFCPVFLSVARMAFLQVLYK